MILHSCPVRAIDPVTRACADLFQDTHHVVIAPMGGAAWYERRVLPHAGGVDEQDAFEMQALDVLRLVHNALLEERMTERRKKKPKRSDD